MQKSNAPFRRALVSTSDKTGLVEFLKPLVQNGMEVVSTGGTSKFLREHGISVKEVAEVTGFPEVMDGRVRTLHPKIHMALLARSHVASDMELLKREKVAPFDLVVVNLYPFEQAFKKGFKGDELIEQIDIGGPSLLRAASKSHERITVVCDPRDYSWIVERAGAITLKERQQLAAKVFYHTSFYDSLVARALWDETQTPREITFAGRLHSSLRYGENPHQKAAWFEDPFGPQGTLQRAEQLQGKELSYNNILDSEAALQTLKLLGDRPSAVIVKHNTPCGVAQGRNHLEAYLRALSGDPISAFGGIVALNGAVSGELAQEFAKLFLECVIAPDFDQQALQVLSAKKNLRLLKIPMAKSRENYHENDLQTPEFKSVQGGFLIQESDWEPTTSKNFSQFKVIGDTSLDGQTIADLCFLDNVVRMVKSNAIAVGVHSQTLGLCGGQTNRVDAVRFALERARKIAVDSGGKLPSNGWILASDAFFPFRDSIDLSAQYGVKWIIQPGGSLRDAEVESAAREHGITMILTGRRHFRH